MSTCNVCGRAESRAAGCQPRDGAVVFGDEMRGDFSTPDAMCAECGTAKGKTHHQGCEIEECGTCRKMSLGCPCKVAAIKEQFETPADIQRFGFAIFRELSVVMMKGLDKALERAAETSSSDEEARYKVQCYGISILEALGVLYVQHKAELPEGQQATHEQAIDTFIEIAKRNGARPMMAKEFWR